MIHRSALVLLAFALATGCGVSKTVKKVKKAVTPSEVVEKIATGDVPGIVAIGFKVLNASQDYAVVHQDQGCLIAEVKKVPVLGLSLTGSKDSRYYLRIDTKSIKDAAGTVKMVFSFYKAAKGAFLEVMNPDSAVGKYAQQIFLHIIGALLKSGVAFK
ncbi:MAG TPA: hypothetical protein VJU16_02830 [Planctomycetota bacterium]|nr:hypothetical protein [Planctomycetota bacterium]